MSKAEPFSLKRLLDLKPLLTPKEDSPSWEKNTIGLLKSKKYQMHRFVIKEREEVIKIGKQEVKILIPQVGVEISTDGSMDQSVVSVQRFKETHEIQRKIDYMYELIKVLRKKNSYVDNEKIAIIEIIAKSFDDIRSSLDSFGH